MTVSTEDVVHRYRPGAAMVAEAIPFQFLDPDHIDVVLVTALGARVSLFASHYLIAGDGMAAAGSVTATGAWAADDVFEVRRATPQLQLVDIPPHEPLPAVAAERQLDRLAMVDQEQDQRMAELAIALAMVRGRQPFLRFGGNAARTAPKLRFGGDAARAAYAFSGGRI